MKKIILAILMITSILTLSEEKTITENNGTLIKKYNSDGILVEVVNNEAEDLGIVKSVEMDQSHLFRACCTKSK